MGSGSISIKAARYQSRFPSPVDILLLVLKASLSAQRRLIPKGTSSICGLIRASIDDKAMKISGDVIVCEYPIHWTSEDDMDEGLIIAAIDAELGRLQQIRAILSGVSTEIPTTKADSPTKKSSRRRRLSPEARKRIADAQKKRWAAAKAAKLIPAKKVSKPARKPKAAKKAPAKAVKKAARKTAAKKAPTTKVKKTTVPKATAAPNTVGPAAANEAAPF